MSNDLKYTPKNGIPVLSELRERISAHLKGAQAEERYALKRIAEDWERYDDAYGIEYVFAMGKQEALESIMTLIDDFSYGSA